MSNCIIDMFETTAKRFPKRIAVADEDNKITFEEFKVISRNIAKQINTECEIVGVIANRNAYTIPLFFAVTYSGRCYIPIDPLMPIEKIKRIVDKTNIDTVISTNNDDKHLAESIGCKMIHLNVEDDNLVQFEDNRNISVGTSNLLYIIFTSGSTGDPKGVQKTHEAMQNYISAYIDEFGFDENTIIGNQTPFCFDASAKDIYLMIACGATLEIIPTVMFSFPVRLMEYLNDKKINFISWVPSALTIVTTFNTFSEIIPIYLKKVFFVGEVFAVKHLNKWIKALPDVEFVNLYGSSEICGIACYFRIKEELDSDVIPIGKALSNCELKIVSDNEEITVPHENGELLICSNALADGYFADDEKTKEQFIYHDFGDGLKRYYHTGDIACYDEQGNLVYVERNDSQIKHMGYRIELGEIENVSMKINHINRSCCIYDSKRSKIILCVQLEKDSDISSKDIKKALKDFLADYMIPQQVKILDEFPLNSNGKINRLALKEQYA